MRALFMLVLSFQISISFSQVGPDIFEIAGITGVNATANGTYERSVTMINGCPCYDRVGGGLGMVYHRTASDWEAVTNRNCATFSPFGSSDLVTLGLSDNCDIRGGSFFNSPLYANATFRDLTPADIPTLSQWGIILLGFSMLIIGVLSLQSSFLPARHI